MQAASKLMKIESKENSGTEKSADTPHRSDYKATGKGAAKLVRVVGVGASAGGLEALVQILRNLPEKIGFAIVIVQHLDPAEKGMMAELLQRSTSLRVLEIVDKTKIQADCIYVIPPNNDLRLKGGFLRLHPPESERGLRLPIDTFLRSLAAERGAKSIGIILSGMGSDGTSGASAIKAAGGRVLVQNPSDAKFPAMPQSAIGALKCDVVAPARELTAKLLRLLMKPLAKSIRSRPSRVNMDGVERVVALVRTQLGHDFGHYRRSTLVRRIERRMALHHCTSIPLYCSYLQGNPQEISFLFKELLIGVTSFFRDSSAWKYLADRVLPKIISQSHHGRAIRAWVAGCSTGEEAYSLAIAFAEANAAHGSHYHAPVQIYATDLDSDAISKARLGFFPDSISSSLSKERLKNFFQKEAGGYRVSKEIRSMIVFAQQNLIMEPPFTKLDLLCCRNLLIYFTPELQRTVFPLFHYSLNVDGFLFLGSSESLGSSASLFSTVSSPFKIYKRRTSTRVTDATAFPPVFRKGVVEETTPSKSVGQQQKSLQYIVDQLLTQRFVPASVLTNRSGDILYISGKTSEFIEPAAGKANWNINAMIRGNLRSEFAASFDWARRAQANGKRLVKGLVTRDSEHFELIVSEDPRELEGLILVVFLNRRARKALAAAPQSDPALSIPNGGSRLLRKRLRVALDELVAARRSMHVTQEDSRALNQELQSANEELQSSNEELTTSKEEMQSLNEELQTVNAEVQARLDQLAGADSDMKNLLNSTAIATIFLDKELNVRSFTNVARTIIRFIPSDVGRPLTDLASNLIYPGLVKDAIAVLRRHQPAEREVEARDGRWFVIRIMPYRKGTDQFDGLVITLLDVSKAKVVERSLRREMANLEEEISDQKTVIGRLLALKRGRDRHVGSARLAVVRRSRASSPRGEN